MKWLPFDVFEFESQGQPEEIAASLRCHVEGQRLVQVSHGRVPFTGIVDASGFRIRMSTGVRDSLAPTMHGRFRAIEDGTTVRVEMIPATSVLLVFVILMGCVVQLTFRSGPQVPLLSLAAVASAWLLSMTCFWLDGGRSKQLLVTLLAKSSTDESQRSNS